MLNVNVVKVHYGNSNVSQIKALYISHILSGSDRTIPSYSLRPRIFCHVNDKGIDVSRSLGNRICEGRSGRWLNGVNYNLWVIYLATQARNSQARICIRVRAEQTNYYYSATARHSNSFTGSKLLNPLCPMAHKIIALSQPDRVDLKAGQGASRHVFQTGTASCSKQVPPAVPKICHMMSHAHEWWCIHHFWTATNGCGVHTICTWMVIPAPFMGNHRWWWWLH